MFTSNKVINETLSLLREHGIGHLVLCPGSRNAGIVHSACQVKEFHTHMATDERSAGFRAIGMALATRKAVAVVVTSGSALANLYPAACEAFYQHVPVVFISADRPAAWIGQMDGQTMPQDGALGRMVKMSVNLPEDNLWHANRLVNEALLCCQSRLPQGPVHINIPVSEPIYEFTTELLPKARVIRLTDSTPPLPCPDSTLIIVGQMPPHDTLPLGLLKRIGEHFAIVAENLSNIPPSLCVNPSHVDWEGMENVDMVITLGGHTVSKEMKMYLRSRCLKEHWHVSPDGAVADVFCRQTLAVGMNAARFLQELLAVTSSTTVPMHLPMKEKAEEDSRMTVLREFFALLPDNAVVFLANSSSVRLAQKVIWTDMEESPLEIPSFFCNRGINGIEGSLSTAVGYAIASPEEKVYVVIGDLSFFYDQNALWCDSLPQNLHILLFNDGRGSIFDTLPLPEDSPVSRHAIIGQHGLTARHLALLYGVRYMEGEGHLEQFVNSNETIIYERLEKC